MTGRTRFTPGSDDRVTPYQSPTSDPVPAVEPQQGAPTAAAGPSKPKKPFYKRWWFWVLVVLAALIGLGSMAGGGESDQAEAPVVQEEAPTGEQETAGETRENPLPLGSTVEGDEWALTINGVDLDATSAVLEENPFNDGPSEGNVYILVNITAEYLGDDAEGAMTQFSVEYVTPDGNTRTTYDDDTFAVAPDSFDLLATLYEGASLSGKLLFSVPADSAGEGVLAVQPEMFSKKTFVAVR